MPNPLQSLLASIGLEELAPLLEEKGVERPDLARFTDEDWQAVGVTNPGDRSRLLAAGASLLEGTLTEEGSGWHTTTQPGRATRDLPFVNSLGMLFIPVPRYKTLLSIMLVRVCDYSTFCLKTGINPQPCDFAQGPDHPVVNVSWQEAVRFCEWMTMREKEKGVLTGDVSYRLPLDIDWSAAVGLPDEGMGCPRARSGKAFGYPWGSSYPPLPGVGNYHPLLKVDPFPETSPVGSFPPSQHGFCDLGGNVWEWCLDDYEPSSDRKTARGASCFNDAEEFLRSSHRDSVSPTHCRNNLGFRVALAPDFAKDPRVRLSLNPWG